MRPPRGRSRPRVEPGPAWLLGPHAVGAQVEGAPQSLREVVLAQDAGPRARAVAERAEAAGVPVTRVSREALAACAGPHPHQGLAARTESVAPPSLEALLARAPRLLVALDGVEDPHNLGAIMRTAWALGAEGLVLPERRAAPLSPAALRAAAGAAAQLPVCRVVNLARALARCREAGLWVVGTAPDAPVALAALDVPPRRVVVMGGEERGMRPGVAAQCDLTGSIALRPRTGSLNVSVACGIALYALGGLTPHPSGG